MYSISISPLIQVTVHCSSSESPVGLWDVFKKSIWITAICLSNYYLAINISRDAVTIDSVEVMLDGSDDPKRSQLGDCVCGAKYDEGTECLQRP